MITSTIHTPSSVRLCSDCGKPAERATIVFDPSIQVEVTLCRLCTLALHQRRHMVLDCCE